ncbi:MAG: alpha/beta hydrolase [Mangrovicoccus sp.]|nr:alpha/beta hydrolase [Mangrovicoccus sp.]
MPQIAIRGAKLNYMQLAQLGSGPKRDLLLCHGLASSMGYWPVELLTQLRAHFCLTLFDQRGHGRSRPTPSGYGATELGADLAAVIAELELQKPDIMAHSFGGVAVLSMLQARPDLARSLVLLDSQIELGRRQAVRAGDGVDAALVAALADVGVTADASDPFVGVHMLGALAHRQLQDIPIETEDARVKFLFQALPASNARRWVTLMQNTDAIAEITQSDGLSPEGLSRIALPMLGLYGQKSAATHSAHLLTGLLPDFSLEILEGSGHFFVASRSDFVLSLCREFWGLEVPVQC